MNVQEACNLLGIPVGASEEDVKKAFKKKAIEFHPDKNKDPGAEATFKRINEASQYLEKNGTTERVNNFSGNFTIDEILRQQMGSVFNMHVNRGQRRQQNNIFVTVEVPFATSVLGGNQNISYERTIRCNSCKGTGKVPNTSVDAKDPDTLCASCKGSGTTKQREHYAIVISPGFVNGTQMVIRGKGHWFKDAAYDDVVVQVRVVQDSEMRLEGVNVISNIELTLLEALSGCKKEVRTIKGNKTLTLKPKTRNGDEIKVKGFGVPNNGSHIINVVVNYPEDVTKLIECLEKGNDGI
jgi:DnaJ-class molecular chaperone